MQQAEKTGKLVSIQIGTPRTMSDDQGEWTSAISKQAVQGDVTVGSEGIEGDAVASTQHHGGVDKAVLAYSADHYADWADELGIAFPMGAFGENLSLSGIDEACVCIGDCWQIGEVVFQVSQPRNPCWKLARRWSIKRLTNLVVQNGRSGWYLRVIQTGAINVQAKVALVSRDDSDWTVARAFRVFYDGSREEKLELAELPALSHAWKNDLTK